MVARGDLGVEMNPWDVPVIQKRIVETCKLLGKPCVIATQMMESMIESPTPTRAEASDCATAIFDSADAGNSFIYILSIPSQHILSIHSRYIPLNTPYQYTLSIHPL